MKVVFCDIDGTFIDMGQEVLPVNVQAVQDLQNQGDHFVFVSGRGIKDIDHLLNESQFDCDVIFANGAGYRLKGQEPVYHQVIKLSQSKQIETILEKAKCFYYVHTNEGLIVPNINRFKSQLEDLKAVFNIYPNGDYIFNYKIQSYTDALQVDSIYEYLKEHPECIVLKYEMMHQSRDFIESLAKDINAQGILAYSSIPMNLEIVHPKSNKGDAIKYYIKDLENVTTYGIGDAENDFALLSHVDVPVAVMNAQEDLKKIAKIIIGKASEGGVGHFIYEHLIKEDK